MWEIDHPGLNAAKDQTDTAKDERETAGSIYICLPFHALAQITLASS